MSTITPKSFSLLCCKGWNDQEPERKADKAWSTLHALCHSRVPFTLATYIERVGQFPTAPRLSPARAKQMVDDAVSLKWLHIDNAERGTWVGRLTKK